jgi:signal transduction histidine kinase
VTRWFRTLHGRLTVGYAIAFLLGLVAFAAVSFAALDAGLKHIVDVRLKSSQSAVVRLITVDPEIGHATRERLALVMGANINGAIFSSSGRAVFSNFTGIVTQTREIVLHATGVPQLSTMTISGAAGRMATQRTTTTDGRTLYVGLWRRLDVVHDFERFSALVFGLAVVVIGGIAIFIGATVARQGLTPLRAVAEMVSEIEAHDLSRRLGIENDPSELGRLCMTFDRMLERLELAFERQRRFTADASHEFRAPLAVIRSAADLALRREREPAAYQRVLTSIVEATERLEMLTGDLLEMARADAEEIELKPVELTNSIDEALDAMRPLALARSVTLNSVHAMPAFVQANRAALVRVVVAVVDNAVKATPAGGAVEVSVDPAESGLITMRVHDTGPGFSRQALERATDRFWRDDTVRAPGSGSGLGLAICDAIVRACGGSLRLANAPRGGAVVLISLRLRASGHPGRS